MQEFAEYEKLSDYCTVTADRLNAAMFGDDAFVEGLIAADLELPIGYALFHPNFSSFRGERGMYLEDIFVKPDHRGSGIGLRMIKEIAGIAASRGYERIDFQVLDWNTPAINFYKKLGAVSNDDETHFKFADKAFRDLAS